MRIFFTLILRCTGWLMATLCVITHAAELNTTLSNGLRVMIKEDHRSPLVMVQVWYEVGGANESEANRGVSHFLEHMMFKGSTRVPGNTLKLLNTQYGGRLNALTSNDYTYYYQLYPKDYLALALELEADRMQNLALNAQDFATERNVVMEERRQRTDDRPQALAFEKFRMLAYPDSAYRYPVMGTMQNIQALSLNDLQQWYRTWYAPNHASLVIVGDVDAQKTLAQVQHFFAALPSEPSVAPANVMQSSHVGYRHVQEFSNVQVPNLYLAWNVPSLATASTIKDSYTLTLLKNLLGNGIAARLNDELVRQQKILSTLSVHYDMISRGDTLFSITAIPNTNVSLDSAQQAIIDSIAQLTSTPLSDAELQRAKVQTLSDLIYSQDTLQGQAQLLGNFAVNGLDLKLIPQLSEAYQEISSEDVQRVVKQYFSQDNLSSLFVQPQAQTKPSTSTSQTTTEGR